jgi:hypothetical protein
MIFNLKYKIFISQRSGENLGKLRAEQFSFYPLLNEGERNGTERSEHRRVNLGFAEYPIWTKLFSI